MDSSSKLEQALTAFNKVSKKQLPDAASFQKMLSVSPKLRAWYEDWSFSNSAFKTMPKSFSDSGISREQWSEVQKLLPKINEMKAASSLEIEKKAAEFSRFVEQENARLSEELDKVQTPLVEILKVNILCLSFDKQFEIMSSPAEKQEELRKQAIEVLRTKLLKDLAEGNYKSPFVYGDFSDLLSSDKKNET